VFGSRQSTPRAWLLGLLFAYVVLVSGVGFIRFVLTWRAEPTIWQIFPWAAAAAAAAKAAAE
jgi:hypothetical protein